MIRARNSELHATPRADGDGSTLATRVEMKRQNPLLRRNAHRFMSVSA
jgi:hypothetical protein